MLGCHWLLKPSPFYPVYGGSAAKSLRRSRGSPRVISLGSFSSIPKSLEGVYVATLPKGEENECGRISTES